MAARRFSADDLLAPIAALLILAVGCASVLRDVSSGREHVPTGLTFPDEIDGLPRMPIATPSPSTNEVDISYASDGTTRLRITLTPLPEGKEADPKGVLKERWWSRTASPPPRHEILVPVLPVLCNSEEVTFAYLTITKSPSEKLGWSFAAALSGHLVVIESQIGQHADRYWGADEDLRDLLGALGWPCRLMSTQEQAQAAERKAEPKIQLAPAASVDPFDEGSTLGPRPVHRDPAPGTYAHARSTGRPYTCETSAGFMGEYEKYVAYVAGDDFVATGHDKMHFARVNGVAYTWSDDPLVEIFGVLLGRIRLRAYEDAYERLVHHPPPRWESIFLFVEPADYDTCTPAKRQQISLPNREFRDMTDVVIARERQYFEASVETLKKLPFAPRLPHPSLIDLFPATRGYAGSTRYSVHYLAHGAGPQGESSELSIGFRAHTSDEPASQCGEARLGRRICEHVATTNRGLEVFRELRVVGSSSRNPRLPHYYANVGDALVSLKYIYWSYGGRSGATAWRAHEFEPGELEAVFDSLYAVGAEDVVRFPGMSISE
jgi:hypothetical protein